MAESLAVLVLLATLVGAVVRPRGWSESLIAVPGALLLLICGAETWHNAWSVWRQILPTIGFLALILVFGHLCATIGVFDYIGALTARRSRGNAGRLLTLVVALAAAVTCLLTLDATVVLLTPVVLRSAHVMKVSSRPVSFACVQLANSGSLLLPISNLTNLLAFNAVHMSFGRFAALMAAPWILAIALEWVGLRTFFRAELSDGISHDEHPSAPRYGLIVLGLTLAALVITSALGVAPAWAALGGVVLLAGPMLVSGQTTGVRLVAEANPGFIAFVLALAVTVDALGRHGASHALSHIVASGSSLAALLGVAFVAALLANVINNIPATLMLLPLVAGQPLATLALLLGVNLGPKLTYAGSLATLLWRRVVRFEPPIRAREFHLYGALSTPVILGTATVALWAAAAIGF